jgi:hypothetical protein
MRRRLHRGSVWLDVAAGMMLAGLVLSYFSPYFLFISLVGVLLLFVM